MSNLWKEEFVLWDGVLQFRNNGTIRQATPQDISTQIIAPLIEEASEYFGDDFGMAKELRDKWLNN